MTFHTFIGNCVLGAAVLVGLGACGQTDTTSTTSTSTTATLASNDTSVCVPIDEANYVFQDGKFRRVKAVSRPAPQPAAPRGPWYRPVESSFAGKGFGWMGLNVRGRTVTLTGTAPDAETKAAALIAGEEAIRATAEGKDVTVLDGIVIEGGEAGVGAALAALENNPSLEACQKAFSDTMQGRNVQFRIGSAAILPASAALLNAVSGVASACSAYHVEIGGHTDSVGDDASNQRLSQNRAGSVRDYLERANVDVTNVTAVGYGETRPIDTSGTRSGDALNRRTEFKVTDP